MTRRSPLLLASIVLGLLVAVGIGLLFLGSPAKIEKRDPTGESFPPVVGESLDGLRTEIPGSFAGQAAILLIGYEQDAQFDIDRWILGLLQAEVPARLVEIPTIPGLLPSVASGWIDNGMRSGIPKEDWGSVVTLYGKAARPVAELTGTEGGRVTRVILLDPEGRIVWFDDTGYSPRKALAVTGAAAAYKMPE